MDQEIPLDLRNLHAADTQEEEIQHEVENEQNHEQGAAHDTSTEKVTLTIGDLFQTVEEAKEKIALFSKQNFARFTVVTNNKKQLIYKCKYGCERKTRSTGARPKMHVNNIGCEAKINLYKRKNEIKITNQS